MIEKPMLAGTLESEDQIKFPVLATRKLDGIRCLVIDGHAVTRKFKPVPNRYIRSQIEKYCPNGFDGEIMSGKAEFNDLQSLVMREDGEPDFEYHVFDYVKDDLKKSYQKRLADLSLVMDSMECEFVKAVWPTDINNREDFIAYEKTCLDSGCEGVIVRSPDSPYKCGRSTLREGWLLKFKRFVDSEAVILGVKEGFHNKNVATKDELGHTKRSSHKENKVLSGSLGKFEVKDIYDGSLFKIGTGKGLTHKLRQEIWDNKEKYIGKIIKYKYQDFGRKDLPRIPIFIGFRDPRDMS